MPQDQDKQQEPSGRHLVPTPLRASHTSWPRGNWKRCCAGTSGRNGSVGLSSALRPFANAAWAAPCSARDQNGAPELEYFTLNSECRAQEA